MAYGQKKGRQWKDCLPKGERECLNVGLGLAKALNAIARLPLTALFEQVDSLEAFEDVAFDDETGRALETFVL
jgi:hypothetical protein